MIHKLYTSGDYLKKNPLWHADESPWKAKFVLRMMARNNIQPQSICDVGCGAGEVLRLVQEQTTEDCIGWGYDISPQALELCKGKEDERTHFKLADIRQEQDKHFDLILLMDIVEHLEDYFSFLRTVQSKSDYKIIQFPLDISVRNVFLGNLLKFRAAYGHIHYFTKEVALQMLHELGYDVVDYLYTEPDPVTFASVLTAIKENPRTLPRKLVGFALKKLTRIPAQIFFTLRQDLAARVLGRWRLIVLAR